MEIARSGGGVSQQFPYNRPQPALKTTFFYFLPFVYVLFMLFLENLFVSFTYYGVEISLCFLAEKLENFVCENSSEDMKEFS